MALASPVQLRWVAQSESLPNRTWPRAVIRSPRAGAIHHSPKRLSTRTHPCPAASGCSPTRVARPSGCVPKPRGRRQAAAIEILAPPRQAAVLKCSSAARRRSGRSPRTRSRPGAVPGPGRRFRSNPMPITVPNYGCNTDRHQFGPLDSWYAARYEAFLKRFTPIPASRRRTSAKS